MARPFVKTGSDASVAANATENAIDYTVTQADGTVTLTHFGINAGDTHVDKLVINIGGGRIFYSIDIVGTSNNLYRYGLLNALPRVAFPMPLTAYVGEAIQIGITADSTGVSARTDVFCMGTSESPAAKDRGAGTVGKPFIKTGTTSTGIANAYATLVTQTVTAANGTITLTHIGIDGVTYATTGRLVVGDETICVFDVNAATSSFFPIPEADTSIMQELPTPVRADIGETITLELLSGSTAFTSEATGVIIGYQEVA